jgi:hypothetical protein
MKRLVRNGAEQRRRRFERLYHTGKKKKRVRDEAKISYIYSPNDAVLNIKELFFKSWVR